MQLIGYLASIINRWHYSSIGYGMVFTDSWQHDTLTRHAENWPHASCMLHVNTII